LGSQLRRLAAIRLLEELGKRLLVVDFPFVINVDNVHLAVRLWFQDDIQRKFGVAKRRLLEIRVCGAVRILPAGVAAKLIPQRRRVIFVRDLIRIELDELVGFEQFLEFRLREDTPLVISAVNSGLAR
jgi:hypothetical protein